MAALNQQKESLQLRRLITLHAQGAAFASFEPAALLTTWSVSRGSSGQFDNTAYLVLSKLAETWSLLDDSAYATFFCDARRETCFRGNERIANGFGGAGADEFAARDAFGAFLKAHYDDIRKWQSTPLLSDVAWVSDATLGKYSFESNDFPLTVESFYLMMNGQPIAYPAFAKSPAVWSSGGRLETRLPLAQDEASKLLARVPGRRVFAVLHLTTQRTPTEKVGEAAMLTFDTVNGTADLFEDVSLKKFVATVPLWPKAAPGSDEDSGLNHPADGEREQ